jgi:stage II sporulation protein R
MEKGLKIINIVEARKKFIIGIILISMMTLAFYGWTEEVYQNRASYKDKLIRFHVLANTDAPEDQELKLKVRDRIIAEMNPKFEKSKSLDQSRSIIEENLKDIEAIAEAEVQRNGYNYDVAVKLEEAVFPTKNYGSITLPAGTYEALRVVIGKGEGSNWWCVLFPPLCFIDMKNGLTNEETKNNLMNVLTEEEFDMIATASQDDQIPIKLKFKVVEIIEQAKLNLGKTVGMK